MKAGRELDALVAEKVMGYEFAIIGEQLKKVIVKGSFGEAIDFSPTTNIADAWKVVDMLKDRFLFRLTQSSEGNWWAEFDNFSADGRVYEESAPLAICLAALKAVGINVEEL